jgi:hypothetical protein
MGGPLSAAVHPDAGRGLLERLEELRNNDGRRSVHEQMDVLRHQDIGVDSGLTAGTSLFQNSFDDVPGFGGCKERKPLVTTEGDEVETLCLLKTRQPRRDVFSALATIFETYPCI